MKYRKLGSTGCEVSVLSYGGSSLGSVFREIDEQEGVDTVHSAFDSGINYFDSSPFYGLTEGERIMGRALEDIPRDRYYLSTKAGRYGWNEFDFSFDRVIRSAEESIKRLQVDYLDILNLHDMDTVMNHNLYTLSDTRLLELLPLIREKSVALINGAPLGSGLLSARGVASWHPAGDQEKAVIDNAVKFCMEQGASLEKMAIQFAVSCEDIPTTLISTANPERIRLNAGYVDETLNMDLVEQVRHILKPILNRDWDDFTGKT